MKVSASLAGMWVLVFSSAIASPLLGGKAQLVLAVHAALLGFLLLRPMPLRLTPIHWLVAANVFALTAHIQDPSSVLNAGGLLVSTVAIVGVAYACARTWGPQLPVKIETCFWWCLCVSFVLSLVLTIASWPSAPTYWPWEAFISAKRLLLLREDVGHTPSLWLTAFLMALVMYRRGALWLVGMLAVALVATKSRLALVYLVNIAIMGAAYWRLPLARPAIFVAPLVFSVGFLVFAVSPPRTANEIAIEAQEAVGDVIRITPERSTVFAGRDLLNKALVAASLEHPFTGSGNAAHVLRYGVDRDGFVAADLEDKAANTESVLRLAVKYGWLYFAAVVVFLISVPIAFRALAHRERVLALTLWAMCLESMVVEGGMDNFHGVSGLLLFLLCALYFHASLSSPR